MNSDKSMFSIGEIAKSVNITRKIILNYEVKGLITPDVKEGLTGNRYYSIDTLTKIRSIRVFQKLGLSLDEIKDYFNGETDLHPLIKRMETMRDELNLNIEKLYERTNKTQNIITEITVNAQAVYHRTYCTDSVSEKSALLRKTALEAMRTYGTDTTRRMYFTQYSLNNPGEIDFCIAVPPESVGKHILNIPPFHAVSTYHHGPYEELPLVREKLLDYAKKTKISLLEKCRHVYIEGPPQHKNPHRFITQVLIPIKE